MAFKLTKAEVKEGEVHIDSLEVASTGINAAVEAFNNGLEVMRSDFKIAVDSYNEQLASIREFTANVANRFEDEISDKSDRWQEGDAGNAAAELRDAWQNIELEDIEIDLPEDIEFEAGDHESALRDLLGGEAN